MDGMRNKKNNSKRQNNSYKPISSNQGSGRNTRSSNRSAVDFFAVEEKITLWQYVSHSGYFICHGLKTFFRHPLKKEKPDLDLLGVVRSLLDDFENKNHKENIQKSEGLIALHRTVENTHARRRLERWSLRIIVLYLFIVFSIVVATYAQIPYLDLPWLTIPNEIMIAILTTTTANIIGLGLIVLRGHFLSKDDKNGS